MNNADTVETLVEQYMVAGRRLRRALKDLDMVEVKAQDLERERVRRVVVYKRWSFLFERQYQAACAVQ